LSIKLIQTFPSSSSTSVHQLQINSSSTPTIITKTSLASDFETTLHELHYYNTYPNSTPFKIPSLIASYSNPTSRTITLVLEDFSWATPITSPSFSTLTHLAKSIAEFHFKWWNHPQLTSHPLNIPAKDITCLPQAIGIQEHGIRLQEAFQKNLIWINSFQE